MASRLTPSIQRQLEKLAQMLASEKDTTTTKAAGKAQSSKSAVERDDMSVILQEDAAAAALVAESSPSASSSDCNCSKNTQLLEKLAKEVRRIHELLERIEERKPEIEDLASRAERLARADAALAAIANTATVNEVPLTEALVEQMMQPQIMVAPPPMVLPPQPAFVVTESSAALQQQQPPAAGLPHPSVDGGGGGTTFDESTRVVAEGDVATLQQMLETTWRERTKHLYSEQRLAEEPQEPPSAMDVFRDATAELAQDPNVRTKSEFLDRLRLIVKQTAPGILSTLPENPHAHHTMLELWGAEWVS